MADIWMSHCEVQSNLKGFYLCLIHRICFIHTILKVIKNKVTNWT